MDATSDGTPDASPRHRLRGQLLLLRGRAGLTQHALATLLGISEKAVQKWEVGDGHPSPARLQALIALYLERQMFPAGHEEEEARALWELLRGEAARRIPPFDEAWFATLQPATPAAPPAGGGTAADTDTVADRATGPRRDWGEAPDVSAFQGRQAERQTLGRWLQEDRCRMVALLGLGGIGKTALATYVAQELAPHFAGLCWRSLRNALPPEEWLGVAIAALAPDPPALPPGLPARLQVLLELLRAQRCLLVLDNLETVLEPGESAARYRAVYEGYGEALRQLSESGHQSCVLLTAREAPPELALLAGTAPVRALRLGGLDRQAGRALLADKDLEGDESAWGALVERYGGNPLALRVVGQTIAELFGGQIAALLAYATETQGAVFGGLRRLLEAQVARLAPLERSVLYWLAIEREPVGVAALATDLGPGAAPPGAVLEALEGLGRRSLLERGAQSGTHTLQPVVLEYVSERLVAEVVREVIAGEPGLLVNHALLQATTKDYVRRSQERLIAQPLLEQLRASLGSTEAVERRLLDLLAGWRGRAAEEQGFGPGTVVNLLRLLRGDLRGLDLARLSLRQAYLAEVEAQDASLAGAHLAEAALAEAFDYPTTVALSVDGAFLAAGTSTGEVRLWRVGDRTPVLAAQGHSGVVGAVALCGDGKVMASGGYDGTVRLWAAPSGQLLATMQGHSGAVYRVALSGDGTLLASGSQDGTVRLWEVPSGRPLATLVGHGGAAPGVALSGDGTLLASGGHDGTVRLWEVSSGRPLVTMQGHSGAVHRVALSTDGQVVASSSEDGTVRLWEAPNGRPLATLVGHGGAVFGVALSGDGTLLASSGYDRTVRLWEAPNGRPLATVQGHGDVVWDVALSGDGQVVASGSQDGTVRLWEAPSRRPLATLQGHTGGVLAVALSGGGQVVASGSQDGAVKLWEVPSGRPLATLQGHTGGVWGVALSEDGGLLASGSQDGAVRLWAVPSGRPLTTLLGHSGAVHDVALSADGRLVASGGFDGTVRLWEAPSGRPLATIQGYGGQVWGVALSGDGQVVAGDGFDGTVRLWEAPSGRLLATLQGHTDVVLGMALSRDGGLLASGSQDGTVRLWAAPNGRPLATLQGHTGAVFGVALSGDGQVVASGSQDGTVRLWEAPSGRLLATLQGHTGGVWGAALSRDGRLVASGSMDGTVRLWEASSGTCLHTLRAERRYERLEITGLTGVTEAQRAALLALGAVDRST